jgi:glycopeptide antibiotics resistance protein
MIGIVIVMELLQFLTLSGSCDIDDIILNVFGACLMLKIINASHINSLIKRVLFKEIEDSKL